MNSDIISFKNFNDLKANFDRYYQELNIAAENFGNPQVYFHKKAIECCRENSNNDFLSDKHLEYIYATLVAWGMNSQKAKMPTFENFRMSLISQREDIIALKDIRIETLPLNEIDSTIQKLITILHNINATETKSWLVSSSKTLSHILPDLVPPMDRQYTVWFFNAPQEMNSEKCDMFFCGVMKALHEFYQDKTHVEKVICNNEFNTSLPKIFDNLIITYRKLNG